MDRADTVDPTLLLGSIACATLSCLFLVSTVILVLILVRRARRGSAPDA